jgi:hypothetical protein
VGTLINQNELFAERDQMRRRISPHEERPGGRRIADLPRAEKVSQGLNQKHRDRECFPAPRSQDGTQRLNGFSVKFAAESCFGAHHAGLGGSNRQPGNLGNLFD